MSFACYRDNMGVIFLSITSSYKVYSVLKKYSCHLNFFKIFHIATTNSTVFEW